ncbi:MAG: phBC6A51 family helix-turn-helix protein [Polyangiaceae bacterium]
MSEPNETDLEPKRTRALALFLEGADVGEVARETGVSRTTLWRWREDPAFAHELATKRQRVLEAARDDLRATTSDAVAVLRAVLRDDSQPPGVRLRAIEMVLARSGLDALPPSEPPSPKARSEAMSLREKRDFAARVLASLEKQLAEGGP